MNARRCLTPLLLGILVLLAVPWTGIAVGPREVLKGHEIASGTAPGCPSSTGMAAGGAGRDAFCLRRTTQAESATAQDPEAVRHLQAALQAAGYYQGCRIDGWFGPYTQRAVMEYQRDHGLPISGVVDRSLYDRILGQAAGKAATAATSKAATSPSKPATDTGSSNSSVRAAASDGWVTVKPIVHQYQDTSYTCGPTSLAIALSVFGITRSESWLAGAAGTTRSGTGHAGLFQAVRKANQATGQNVRIWDQSFASTGWSGLLKFLSGNNPVILNLRSWFGNWGHYLVLAGINMKTRQVKLADPSGGWRVVSFKEMEWRMAWHTSPSVIPVVKGS